MTPQVRPTPATVRMGNLVQWMAYCGHGIYGIVNGRLVKPWTN